MPTPTSHRFFRSLVCGMVVVGLSACAGSILHKHNWNYEQAESLYNEEKYDRAVAIYNSLLEEKSQQFRRDSLLFRIGECYQRLGAPAEARLAYLEVQQYAPGSVYQLDVRNRLAELETQKNELAAIPQQRREDAQRRLEEARRKLSDESHPAPALDERGRARVFVDAAEALWDLEQYEDARDAYVEAINLQPALRHDARIRGRLQFPPEADKRTGGVVNWLTGHGERTPRLRAADVIPMTPQGLLRWPGGALPLMVFNTTMRWERVGQDPRVRTAVVTGQVKNQYSQRVGRARIEVSLTNVRIQVLDVAYAEVPELNPGETTSFLVRLGPFDDYENINTYTCRVLLSAGEVARR